MYLVSYNSFARKLKELFRTKFLWKQERILTVRANVDPTSNNPRAENTLLANTMYVHTEKKSLATIDYMTRKRETSVSLTRLDTIYEKRCPATLRIKEKKHDGKNDGKTANRRKRSLMTVSRGRL